MIKDEELRNAVASAYVLKIIRPYNRLQPPLRLNRGFFRGGRVR